MTKPTPSLSHSGFSLIDTLLGVGLFLVVTVALIQFTLTTLRAADNLDLQLRAQNAAREALEIMENIRGTNAIHYVTWETEKHHKDFLQPLMGFSDLKNGQPLCVTLSPTPDAVVPPWRIQRVQCPAEGDMTPPANSTLQDLKGEVSDLTRYVRIRRAKESPTLQAFWNGIKSTSQLPRGDDDIIEVEAVVGWENRGERQQLVLRKVLADWYQ